MDIQAYIQSGIIESYVLGLASEEEIAEVENLRGRYDAVDQAILAFEQQLERNGKDLAIEPPASLRQQLFERLEEEFVADNNGRLRSMESPFTNDQARPITRQLQSWKWLAAASVVLFLANTILSIVLFNNFNRLDRQYNELLAENQRLQSQSSEDQVRLTRLNAVVDKIQDTGMFIVRLKGVKGKEASFATVYWDSRTKEVFILPGTLPAPPAGKQYQLWALVDSKPVDAGMIGDCDLLCKMKNIPRAQAFAVTLEKAGGSPTPDLSSLFVMGGV